MSAEQECHGCGREDATLTRVCPECNHQFCTICDMGDDVECESCLDIEETLQIEDFED